MEEFRFWSSAAALPPAALLDAILDTHSLFLSVKKLLKALLPLLHARAATAVRASSLGPCSRVSLRDGLPCVPLLLISAPLGLSPLDARNTCALITRAYRPRDGQFFSVIFSEFDIPI